VGNVSSKAQLPLSPRLVDLGRTSLPVRLSAAGGHPASASHAGLLHDDIASVSLQGRVAVRIEGIETHKARTGHLTVDLQPRDFVPLEDGYHVDDENR
jgi:hypothetical protein